MATPTHVLQVFSGSWYVGPDEDEDYFEMMFRAFDEENFAAYIFSLPRPGWPDDFKAEELAKAGEIFLQAGGAPTRMTLDTRVEKHGRQSLCVVGRTPSADTNTAPEERVKVGENEATVQPNEVFEWREAAQIFYYYYKTMTVPDGYVLREVA
ncbi:hypothetical protein [Gordonia sp. CPCC 205333]|uniref:hypothetical protein n=1 Tax=Gordonia sp. CPCC 205333 TaxID=3140790 RepID=UPI003AF33C8C